MITATPVTTAAAQKAILTAAPADRPEVLLLPSLLRRAEMLLLHSRPHHRITHRRIPMSIHVS